MSKSAQKLSNINSKIKCLLKQLRFENALIKYEKDKGVWNGVLRESITGKRYHIFHSDLYVVMQKMLTFLEQLKSHDKKLKDVQPIDDEYLTDDYVQYLEKANRKQLREIEALKRENRDLSKKAERVEKLKDSVAYHQNKLTEANEKYTEQIAWKTCFKEILNDHDKFREIHKRVLERIEEKKQEEDYH
jgi:hypothetical protein